jgi:hypothetical protein
VRRSWLGASALGHLALFACVFAAAARLEDASIHYDYASLDDFIGAATINWSTAAAIAAAGAFLIICPLNHYLYLRARSARLPRHSDGPLATARA